MPSPLFALSLMLNAQAAQLDDTQLAQRAQLLERYDELTTLRGPDDAGRGTCLTGLVLDLQDSWHLFEPADQQRMADFLAPWGGNDLRLLDPVSTSEEPPPPPPADGDQPCFGHHGDDWILTEHFSVEWERGVDRELAEHFAESLEYSWDKEVTEFGWNRPDGTDDYPMLAYIADEDGYAGAYTTVEWCGGEYVPYIVAYSGSWSSEAWAEDMACHEFNHTIQFSTSYAPEFWYWEATAIWMEEQVYPSHNYWTYYVDAYTSNPWIGLTASSQRDQDIFYHMYGGAIFNFFLDNWYDGHASVKGMWDYAETDRGQYSLPVWDNVEGIGLDWDEVFAGFLAANTVMDYDEQSAFPGIDIHQAVSTLPADGSSSASDEPESLGQNYIRFDDGLASEGDLHVTFQGEAGPDQWYAVLVATANRQVVEVVRIELDDDHRGEGWIQFQGGDVFLAVAPWDEGAEGYHYNWENAPSYEYSWQADAEEGGGPDDTEEPDDTGYEKDTDLPVTPGDDTPGVGMPGCGCASGAAAPSAALLSLLGLLGLARRRD
jgi:MYXO-CTERM domain-containing protein